MANGLNEAQLLVVSNIERICSALSLVGSLFVIVTFCFFNEFHKPINRLVFFATFGNMMTNVGTLMSRSYIQTPASPGCQLQAFLIQMFMPADAFWTLAMAVNVYLTFYYRFDGQQLRKMEVPYLLCCYGIPFIPALVFVFLKDRQGNMVYGDAILWCWVTVEWNIWRILTFYGPVWVLILITFFIYIRAGRTIYKKRKQLRNITSSDPDPLSANREPGGIIKTTEVTTTERSPGEDDNDVPLHSMARPGSGVHTGEYAVTIAADSNRVSAGPSQPTLTQVSTLQPPKNASAPWRIPNSARRRNYEVNNAAWAYTKCAILFFTALLITWIPSSANRVYSFVHPDSTLPPLEFMSAFVLPLQGFWNAIIYVVTSWSACQSMMDSIRHGRRPAVTELVGGVGLQSRSFHEGTQTSRFRSSRRLGKDGDSESTTELANSGRSSSQ